jgi:hypothetical protein
LIYKRLDRSLFEIPDSLTNESTVMVSEAVFEAIFAGLSTRIVH